MKQRNSKIVVVTLLCLFSLTLSAQKHMYVWQDGVKTTFAVADVDSITFTDETEDSSQKVGKFSISATQQIAFSSGNLQYHPLNNQWRFAESQIDCVGEANANISPTYDGWVDLFCWGTGDEPTRIVTNNNAYLNFVDWGTNSIGTDTANTWRTMSADELRYILFSRPNAAALNGIAHINGVNGLVLLPDDWVAIEGLTFNSGAYGHSSRDYYAVHNTFTLEQWQQMEEAGAIFLPAVGYRQGNSIYASGSKGYYWTTSPNGGCGPITLEFSAKEIITDSSYRYSGLSIRLIKDIE
jgi:hypothetical protein